MAEGWEMLLTIALTVVWTVGALLAAAFVAVWPRARRWHRWLVPIWPAALAGLLLYGLFLLLPPWRLRRAFDETIASELERQLGIELDEIEPVRRLRKGGAL